MSSKKPYQAPLPTGAEELPLHQTHADCNYKVRTKLIHIRVGIHILVHVQVWAALPKQQDAQHLKTRSDAPKKAQTV